MNIVELQKERILCRKDNPVRANVIGGLVDGAKKIAKKDNREILPSDVFKTAKKSIKALNNTLSQIKPTDALYLQYQQEIKILKAFLPAMPTEKEVKEYIEHLVKNLETDPKKSVGIVMNSLKAKYPDVDGKQAILWVREYLEV